MPVSEARIAETRARAYRIPTDAPESDGTLEWNSTTMVLVELDAAGKTGIGYSYVHQAAAHLIEDKLAGILRGRDAFAIRDCWHAMVHACRNLGRPGIVACAISACDVALHDLGRRRTRPSLRPERNGIRGRVHRLLLLARRMSTSR